MDLHHLRYVVALAEEASFSRAAARLGVAQPSLSQQIKKLEADVGRPLFDRLPRRVVPTQAGQRLVEHARLILAHFADAVRHVGETDGQVAGPVAVGAIPTIAPFVLPGLLTELARKHPAVRPQVVEDVTDRLIEMVERGDLDVAILSTHPGGRTVHVERIATEPLLLVVGPRHRLAKAKSVAPDQLAGERLLVLHEMHCLSGQVRKVCDRRRLSPAVVMRGAQLATIAGMVGAGLGVSIVPEMMRRAGGAGRCAFVRLGKEEPTREICAAWSLLRYRTGAARAVVDLLRARLGTKRDILPS
ncbi:MAG TPA: hydrogen peroxide-inducible genes activator [Tepidisphaeraceae bacterium]|nr:hydrogen peroxide-inducible genes activator [Tepidisphaeraceae bacterium]